MMASRRLWLAALLVLVPVFGGASDLEIASVWSAAPVKIDGTAEKWSALTKPLGDVPMVMGVQNDGEYLYLLFKTSDSRTRLQLGRYGLTVWANGEGKTQKGFGVRFPLGMGRQRPRGRGPQGSPSTGEAPATGTAQAAKDFEVIGPTENDRLHVQPGPDQPIAAALGGDASAAVVELRLPLKATEGHPLAVGAAPGTTIALGLTTESPRAWRAPGGWGGQPPTPTGQPKSTAPGSGQGGTAPVASGGGQDGTTPIAPGLGRAGGRYGGNARGGRDMTSAVSLWVRVSLAQRPASGKQTSAPPAPTAVPKAGKPVLPAKAPARPANTAAPANTPAPPKTP